MASPIAATWAMDFAVAVVNLSYEPGANMAYRIVLASFSTALALSSCDRTPPSQTSTSKHPIVQAVVDVTPDQVSRVLTCEGTTADVSSTLRSLEVAGELRLEDADFDAEHDHSGNVVMSRRGNILSLFANVSSVDGTRMTEALLLPAVPGPIAQHLMTSSLLRGSKPGLAGIQAQDVSAIYAVADATSFAGAVDGFQAKRNYATYSDSFQYALVMETPQPVALDIVAKSLLAKGFKEVQPGDRSVFLLPNVQERLAGTGPEHGPVYPWDAPRVFARSVGIAATRIEISSYQAADGPDGERGAWSVTCIRDSRLPG